VGEVYDAHSPTLHKKITYTEDEIWSEIDRILSEDSDRRFTPGQNLFFNIPHFCNPMFFFSQETMFDIQEYSYIKKFNIPISNSIDDAEVNRLVIYQVISEEMNACENRMREKNNAN